jgi:hypothetical protein
MHELTKMSNNNIGTNLYLYRLPLLPLLATAVAGAFAGFEAPRAGKSSEDRLNAPPFCLIGAAAAAGPACALVAIPCLTMELADCGSCCCWGLLLLVDDGLSSLLVATGRTGTGTRAGRGRGRGSRFCRSGSGLKPNGTFPASILRNVMEILLAWTAGTQCLATSDGARGQRDGHRAGELAGADHPEVPAEEDGALGEEGDGAEGAGEVVVVHVRRDAVVHVDDAAVSVWHAVPREDAPRHLSGAGSGSASSPRMIPGGLPSRSVA